MKPLKVVMIVLIAALITSVYINFSQYFVIQQMNLDIDSLNQIYHNLNQSYNDLNQSFLAINQIYSQLIDDINHYKDATNQNSTFRTPISKSQAIKIALAISGWNATFLRGKTVDATLQYMIITKVGLGESWRISDVVEPAESYSPVQNGAITYRYVWNVFFSSPEPNIVMQTGSLIDASSGEILCIMIGPYDFDF